MTPTLSWISQQSALLFSNPRPTGDTWAFISIDGSPSRNTFGSYSTKALTTVKAMGILGNSTRGLLPLQKRLLYRFCVVPIATYGFRLWYFSGAPTKAQVSLLATMQRKAALWILGAFRTSPTGGIVGLAGLIPIHLHLKKLAKRSCLRAATLPSQHALLSLLSARNSKGAHPHPQSLALLTDA